MAHVAPNCSSTNCVANCDAKSYCDPGYGAEWSEIGECPLRVCCSTWGFCGLTEEFCGDKKVRRPSCEASEDSIRRVVVAIGGWDFTEPWKATRDTFSDLAASETSQRAFFASLISFMSMYSFDGVDIDWEYPAAEDRSGRSEDFAEYCASLTKQPINGFITKALTHFFIDTSIFT
ncbi:glycoside hydrolase superfamily [Phialemonium atrogriseum]|uniref:Glycoside hydrolase superfamily n=1 Tax=Phialemonium atrogriseum TaxID=1093897 RepID=A0AAJ0C392_9PEZI|nr:glycoside hydrolase superfamily [Phialemonium atrogriseum]KAK1769126.1 glycoside hydrolase superfamily [Phialemonium atrogriseum]